MSAYLAAVSAALGLRLSRQQMALFDAYRDLILEATERFNLTALRSADDIERRHFAESLALGAELVRAGAMPEDGGCRAIDIGSGAGIPGLAIKVAWPRLRLSLLESNHKRCEFLRQAAGELTLADVEVLEGRAEDWGREHGYREAFDLALARAVAPLPVLLEYATPFLRAGGWLAAPKGSAAGRELAESAGALRELGAEVLSAAAFEPPGGPRQTLVLVRKVGQTPERYPRRAGTAAKRPLSS